MDRSAIIAKQLADGASLGVDEAWWADDVDGPSETIVRLLLDGKPTRAVTRAEFLELFDIIEAEPVR